MSRSFAERDALDLDPTFRRLTPRMQSTAILAGPGLFIGEEGLEERRQVFDEVFNPELNAMQQRVALKAIPFETILLIVLSRRLHD